MSTWETVLAILGLGVISLATRAFFLIPRREIPLPGWLTQGLRYAPLAALAAVIVPEVVMTQGQLTPTWLDARLFAALAGALLFFWRKSVLLTLLGGMAVYLPLHLVLGW